MNYTTILNALNTDPTASVGLVFANNPSGFIAQLVKTKLLPIGSNVNNTSIKTVDSIITRLVTRRNNALLQQIIHNTKFNPSASIGGEQGLWDYINVPYGNGNALFIKYTLKIN